MAPDRSSTAVLPTPPGHAAGAASDLDLPLVSIIIVNRNGRHHLSRCLSSIARQSYPACEVILVDNDSDDGSVDYVRETFPWVRLVRNEHNVGFAQGNNVGFEHATGHYLAGLNPDTEVEPGWLRELVLALEANPGAAMATPKILLMDDPTRANACGNEITITGLTFCRGLDEPADRYNQLQTVSAVSGAAFLISRRAIERLGGFDESFFMYYEDTDLSLRAMLAGYSCIYVPTSVIYHQYAFKFSPMKCFYQERNRYLSLLKTLRWRTLIILLPALLLSEFVSWGYVLLQGPDHIRSKLRAYWWLLANRRTILAARRRVQATRRVDDRQLLRSFSHHLTFTRTVHPWTASLLKRVLVPILYVIGWLARRLVVW